MKNVFITLAFAIALTGCGDNTAATVTTEGASSTSSGPNLTEGVSQTSNPPTTTVEMSGSGGNTSTSSESTTGDPLTSTSLEPTTSGATGDTSTTEVGTTDSSTTSDANTCEAPCPDDHVTREQVALDMGKTCEELFSPMLCQKPNESVSKAEAVKLVSNFLEQLNKLNGCDDFMPLEHPDVEMGDWYFQHVQNLHCVGILNEMVNENFCPNSMACQGWWMDLWAKAQMVP